MDPRPSKDLGQVRHLSLELRLGHDATLATCFEAGFRLSQARRSEQRSILWYLPEDDFQIPGDTVGPVKPQIRQVRSSFVTPSPADVLWRSGRLREVPPSSHVPASRRGACLASPEAGGSLPRARVVAPLRGWSWTMLYHPARMSSSVFAYHYTARGRGTREAHSRRLDLWKRGRSPVGVPLACLVVGLDAALDHALVDRIPPCTPRTTVPLCPTGPRSIVSNGD